MILSSYLQGITFFKSIRSKKTFNISKIFKVKSDRINALRKQYDAFLEEDKRRKERNEYILGRLDKMRYCTAVVPLRHKSSQLIDRRDDFSTSSSLSQLNKSSLDIPRQLDEAAVLQEISKKYILIPKIRPTAEAENISLPSFKPSIDENGDWKSKYEILDQLKKREKDSDATAFSAELTQSNNNYNKLQAQEADALTFDSEQHNYDGPQKLHVEKYEASYENKVEQTPKYEVPEKDREEIKPKKISPFEKKMEYEHYPFAELHKNRKVNEEPQTKAAANILPQNYIEFNNSTEQLETNAYIQNEPQSTPLYYSEPQSENQNTNIQDYPFEETNAQVDPAVYSKQNLPIEDEKDVADTEKVYPEDIEPVEVLRPDDLVKQINITAPNETEVNMEQNEQEQFPIEPINVEDFTPGNNVILQEGFNINPEGFAIETATPIYNYNSSSEIAENIDNPDNSGIEAFETEQREMFYSEETNENYEYNQENVAEAYNQEPIQAGDYAQGEEAVYYEGYEAEQAYPVEIGEHEDATQRYDPHYEQQYAANYTQPEYGQVQEGYEQQLYAQDPQNEGNINHPQYEGEMNQIQEGLEHLQFEQQHTFETAENIEHQLDTEQGYKEQINMNNIEKPLEELQKPPVEGPQSKNLQAEKRTT